MPQENLSFPIYEAEFEPMTLVLAARHCEHVLIAADGMAYHHQADSDYSFSSEKLHQVVDYGWIFCFSGEGRAKTAAHKIDEEIRAQIWAAPSPSIVRGGDAYLQRVKELTQGIRNTSFMLVGHDDRREAKVMSTSSEEQGISGLAEFPFAIGAQRATALWMLKLLLPCCTSLEQAKRVMRFTIWQVAKSEIKVGALELGYRIGLCVLSPGMKPDFVDSDPTSLRDSLGTLLGDLQQAFKAALQRSI
jgi:hypothetical protein